MVKSTMQRQMLDTKKIRDFYNNFIQSGVSSPYDDFIFFSWKKETKQRKFKRF